MLFYQLIIFSIIQGLTEFLPVSSSGHLVIYLNYLKWSDQSNLMAVAVHLGTLGAVVIYFWRDIISMICGFLRQINGHKNYEGQLAWIIIIGTLPAILVGFCISYFNWGLHLNTVPVIAWTVLIYGILLGIMDKYSPQVFIMDHMTFKQSLLVGCAQALALIPGTSRSGACITMMRRLGYKRADSAKFSFLLSIPAIIGASVLTLKKALHDQVSISDFQQAGMAALIAFVAGLCAISLMMRWLRTVSYQPYVWYRIALGLGLLYWVYVINS